MKIEKVVRVKTDSMAEEQFLLTRCPGAVWYPPLGFNQGATFFFDEKEEGKVRAIVYEWKIGNKENKE